MVEAIVYCALVVILQALDAGFMINSLFLETVSGRFDVMLMIVKFQGFLKWL